MQEALKTLSLELDGSLHFDTLHQAMYATDASVYRILPLAVAYPKNVSDIQKVCAFAKAHKTHIIPRTAGTSLAGQCVGSGIVVDVSKHFTKIVAFDASKKQITVQPGVIRDELNRFLAPHGLFFGPNTSTANRCMIGGMVGNNSSGTTSIKYGVTRDKVVAIKAVLSDGTEAEFNRLDKGAFKEKRSQTDFEGSLYKEIENLLQPSELRTHIESKFPKASIHRKNTGYYLEGIINSDVFQDDGDAFNFCELLAGSEGTLAFTTEITLQLDELPPAHGVIVAAHFDSISKCMQAVVPVMKHDLYTCEMMDKVILDCTKDNREQSKNRFFINGDPKAILLLELRANSREEALNQADLLIQTLIESKLSYAYPVLVDQQITQAFELRKAGLGLLGNMVGDHKAVACIEDTAVALEDLSNYISEFTVLMQKYGQEAVYYAHAGAGEIHLRPILNLKKSTDVALFRKITSEVAALVKKYNGSLSGEHGDGIARSEFIEDLVGARVYAVYQEIKTIFDPHSIFNAHKIVDPLQMDSNLRYEVNREEPIIDTFLDFSADHGILRSTEKCNGSGDCRKLPTAGGTMCPSYHATKDEKHTTRARANTLREFLTKTPTDNTRFNYQELKEVFDLCISCKACATECPSSVNVSLLKAEFEYQFMKSNGASLRTRFLANNIKFAHYGSKIPLLFNTFNTLFSPLIKKSLGIAASRSLPKVVPFKEVKNATLATKGISVVLYIDEFTQYYEGTIGQDAQILLERLGYKVTVLKGIDSCRSLLSKGFLDKAKALAIQNINKMQPLLATTNYILGIEPSAILTFKDEYKKMIPANIVVDQIADKCMLIDDFIARQFDLGKILSSNFTNEIKELKIHLHCHQKAIGDKSTTFKMLNIPKNYIPKIIPSGCCGMAGSFGYEKEHYDISLKIGEQTLFPAIRKAPQDTVIVANGTSCRHQIADGVGRVALHPVTVLKQALITP